MEQYQTLYYSIGALALLILIIKMIVPSYIILNIEVIDSNKTYYTLKALVKDKRLQNKFRKPSEKQFLCTMKGDYLLVIEKESQEIAVGYSNPTIENCILDYNKKHGM